MHTVMENATWFPINTVLEVQNILCHILWIIKKHLCIHNPLQHTVTQGHAISRQFLIVETPLVM
jgi:hypothetical protein